MRHALDGADLCCFRDDLAIRSISDVEAGTPADKGQQTNDQER